MFMAFSFPKASIVIPTYNNAKVLRKVLKGMQKLEYPNSFEAIVVDDGSRDNTAEMMKEFSKDKRVRFLSMGKNSGVCKARNTGIKASRFPILVNMDHDCIPEKDWLTDLVKGFEDPKVGVISSFGDFGGTSTAFRKNLLRKVGGYDERYFYYREDTDLTFSIMDLGYKFKKAKMKYYHDHKELAPKGFWNTLKYLRKRLHYHKNDALLFKKHKKLAAKFLDVKLGFLVSPKRDFQVVTGQWLGPHALVLSSPRGIHFLENKSPLHAVAIILAGIGYVIAVKFYRLLGSIKFGTFLL